jgi:hypothetical protein
MTKGSVDSFHWSFFQMLIALSWNPLEERIIANNSGTIKGLINYWRPENLSKHVSFAQLTSILIFCNEIHIVKYRYRKDFNTITRNFRFWGGDQFSAALNSKFRVTVAKSQDRKNSVKSRRSDGTIKWWYRLKNVNWFVCELQTNENVLESVMQCWNRKFPWTSAHGLLKLDGFS